MTNGDIPCGSSETCGFFKLGSQLSKFQPKIIPSLKKPHVSVIFGTSLNQTSDFIIGENGVYKLKVLNRKETGFKDDSIDANFVVSYKNQLLNSNRTSAFARVYESLKENTEVSDNRSIYY